MLWNKLVCSLTLSYHLDSRWFCYVGFWRIWDYFQKILPAFWWLQLSTASGFCGVFFVSFFPPQSLCHSSCLKSEEEINMGESFLILLPSKLCIPSIHHDSFKSSLGCALYFSSYSSFILWKDLKGRKVSNIFKSSLYYGTTLHRVHLTYMNHSSIDTCKGREKTKKVCLVYAKWEWFSKCIYSKSCIAYRTHCISTLKINNS